MSLSSGGLPAVVDVQFVLRLKGLRREERDRLHRYHLGLIEEGRAPPRIGRGFRWARVARDSGVAETSLRHVRLELHSRWVAWWGARETADGGDAAFAHEQMATPKVIDVDWVDPEGFSAALDLHIRRCGDTVYSLRSALALGGVKVFSSTLASWRRGTRAPQSEESLVVLGMIERRYGLPRGYFQSKCVRRPRAVRRMAIPGISSSEMRRLSWHLPADFADRNAAERQEILAWVRDVIVTGSTEYRRFQAAALKHRYGLKFWLSGSSVKSRRNVAGGAGRDAIDHRAAPEALNEEMRALVEFKTSTLTASGYRRSGVWGSETADQRVEHLGLLLGALTASPNGPVGGQGVPLRDLSLGLLAFPAVWDWYVQWRERRRGFYTAWEVDLLSMGVALTRSGTGWVRQTPALAAALRPIPGMISEEDVAFALEDWDAVCERGHRHGLARIKEIERVAKVHRDPFEAILPILEADQPLAEYRKIADEIVRRLPDARRYPKAAAECVRSVLMIRIALHTGLRQRNLRELLLCPRGSTPRTDRALADQRRGELRWNGREEGWEIYIPAAAFKNATSSFFAGRPFRLMLPDLAGLYGHLESYLDKHRAVLLGRFTDPGTFFVKSVKARSRTAAYDSKTFYEAWRLAIQRYGIFNPYTGLGAIEGLLPHGPHNVRDVLATHILKQTGSYEQASYAIQDTPEVVAKHYGRFLPQDKASLAAQVLNKVWGG
jgi:hypothetical protein